ncbi:dihydroneopterin aldolase [Amphibacillus sp. MSJ-3]|uniref:dihydroneopterin aldolase n=1 Tax=Amphibacillus sp. MSJ-3 TaxID=2841505 RepID=UPI001C0EC463|nr:dihydroneopterin aldolase [Amphibacillus sp. MSJ-3]MBU5595521.1 dihydroneopterin aldolase [Amphibacillus sp. MSJ-3]
MDKIYLNGLSFYGYHGAIKEENVLGQRFIVDLELLLDLRKAGESDELTHSIHYGEVYELTKLIVEKERYTLIEAVAERIASKLLTTYPLLQACKVKVVKPDPPIAGHYQSVAVEIYREREIL